MPRVPHTCAHATNTPTHNSMPRKGPPARVEGSCGVPITYEMFHYCSDDNFTLSRSCCPTLLTLFNQSITPRAANVPPRLRSADRAKLGCSLGLDEAEDAVQIYVNMDVRTCSGTDLLLRDVMCLAVKARLVDFSRHVPHVDGV